jgi:hypothetical protein
MSKTLMRLARLAKPAGILAEDFGKKFSLFSFS